MVTYDEIRCYHFHPDGTQVGKGCPYRNSCNYAHPGDSSWDTAKTSPLYSRFGPKGPYYRQRKYSTGDRNRPRSRSRSRDNGWKGRRRRSSASRSPTRQRRRDSIASSVASERDNDPGDRTTLIKPSHRGPTESPHPSKAPPVQASSRTSFPPPPPEQTPPVLPPPPPLLPIGPKARTDRPSLLDRIKLEEEEESPRVTAPPVIAPEQSPKITAPRSIPAPEGESTLKVTASLPVTAPAKFSKKNWHMNAPIEPAQIMLPTPPTSSADNLAFTDMPPPPPPSSADNMAFAGVPPTQTAVTASFATEAPIKIVPTPKLPSPSKPSIGPPPIPPAARERNPVKDNEADPEHDHKFWLDKIEQIYLAVDARTEFERKKDELALQRHFLNTPGFSMLDATRQNKIKEKIERLDAEYQTAKQAYDSVVQDLTKVEIWPTDIVARERENVEDMKKTKEALEKLHALTIEFEGLVKGGKLSEPVQQDDAMDVDTEPPTPGPSSKPAKRRRTESGSVPSRDADIENLREKLQELNGKYTELDNDLEEGFRDKHEEWVSAVDAKIEEKLAPLTSGLLTPKEMKHMKRDVQALEELIKELAPGIGELADRNTERESRLAEAQRSLSESDTVIASLMQRLDIAEQEREVTRQRLTELEAAYESTIANRPVVPPELPSQEVLYHLLEEPLTDLVRDEWRTIADPVRQDVQKMLLEGNADLRKSVWSSLSSTLKMVETLSQRLGVPQPNIQGSQ